MAFNKQPTSLGCCIQAHTDKSSRNGLASDLISQMVVFAEKDEVGAVLVGQLGALLREGQRRALEDAFTWRAARGNRQILLGHASNDWKSFFVALPPLQRVAEVG